jgi:hypothetical protein
MVPASGLKTGMILRFEKNFYKVLATEDQMSGEKMRGLIHVKLKKEGKIRSPFRSEIKMKYRFR